MKRRGISIRDKMDTFNLSFDQKELLESVSDNLINNPESNVYSNGKRAWFKETKPNVINQIDRQIRKRYNIPEENNMIACLHYPPEIDENGKIKDKKMVIKENKENVLHRFLITTIHDVCDVTLANTHPETFEMRPWVSYKIPDMVGGMLSYQFSNDRNLIIPAKKGFRQVRKTRKVESRHILILDYLISKKQYEELTTLLSRGRKVPEEPDQNIEDALESLKL